MDVSVAQEVDALLHVPLIILQEQLPTLMKFHALAYKYVPLNIQEEAMDTMLLFTASIFAPTTSIHPTSLEDANYVLMDAVSALALPIAPIALMDSFSVKIYV